jgi:hypothetical protein
LNPARANRAQALVARTIVACGPGKRPSKEALCANLDTRRLDFSAHESKMEMEKEIHLGILLSISK